MGYQDIRRRCSLCNRIFVEHDAKTIAIMKEFMPDYEPYRSVIPICNECIDNLYKNDEENLKYEIKHWKNSQW